MTRRSVAGVLLSNRDVAMAPMATDLPVPVAPAMSKCGIWPMSAATAWPATSRPSGMSRGDLLRSCWRWKYSLSMTGRSATTAGLWLGTSMPR